MTRRVFQDGDVFYAQDANQIAYPIPDGQEYIGHGPKVIDNYLDDGSDQIKSRFYNFYNRLKVSQSSGLTFNYLGGFVLLSTGNLVSISAGSINVPDNSTVYIYVASNGTVVSSSALPNESFPLAKLTTSGGDLSGSITDLRDKLVDRISPSTIPSTEIVPTGMVTEYAGNSAPTGWLLCNGAEYQINSYPALFAIIGTNYGGNGTSTFRVPDRRGRVGVGAGQGAGLTNRTLGQSGGQETVTLNVSQIPSHNHGINDPGHSHGVNDAGHNHVLSDPGHRHGLFPFRQYAEGNGGRGDGAELTTVPGGSNTYPSTANNSANIAIFAAKSNISINSNTTGITTNSQGGNGSHENMPPYLVMNYIIKT
jgi:microcystin-dependent protein